MTDQKADDQGKTSDQPDLSNYVPKDDYDKLKTSVESLQSDLEKAKMDLLSDGYMEYLEQKKSSRQTKTAAKSTALLGELTPEEIESLPKTKLLKLAESRIGEKVTSDVTAAFQKELAAVRTQIGNMAAYMEAQDVRSRYPDFDEHASDVQKILENATTDMTIEQAYIQAKHYKSAGKETEEGKTGKKTEKPGGNAPLPDTKQRNFKSREEADAATLAEVKERHGLTSDII